MGNLICCRGENHNKRGGTNVKVLLRKTEKPGKRRRRIDDLVRDVLKKEEREDRQKRKREKKETASREHEKTTAIDAKETSDVQSGKEKGIASDEKEETIDLIDVGPSSTDGNVKECVDRCNDDHHSEGNPTDQLSPATSDINDLPEEQKDEYTNTSYVDSTSRESIPKSTEDNSFKENAQNERNMECQNSESVDSKKFVDMEDETNCKPKVEGNINMLNEEERYDVVDGSSKVELASDANGTVENNDGQISGAEIDVVNDGAEYDNQLDTQKDDKNDITENQVDETDASVGSVDTNKALLDTASGDRNKQCKDDTESDEVALPDDKFELDTDSHPNEHVTNHDDIRKPDTDSPRSEENEKLSTFSEESEWDLNEECPGLAEEALSSEQDEQMNTCNAQEEENRDDPYFRDDVKDNDRLDADKQDDGDKIVNVLKVHDTDNLPDGEENITITHNDDTEIVLRVREKESTPEYDNTEPGHNNETDKESLSDDLALGPVNRSSPMSLRQWGSSGDLRNIKKIPLVSRFKGLGLFGNSTHKLKPFNLLMKATSIVLNSAKNQPQKSLTKQSVVKYGIRNCILHGGKKPQIKAIERLKTDSLNFLHVAKRRHFTEQDRHGSLADLKWSRHMRAEVRRHIGMESWEFEELKFMTRENTPDDDEFDVCDTPRASTPVPGGRPSTNNTGAFQKLTMQDKLKTLRERYGSVHVGPGRPDTPTRLGACSRPTTPNYCKQTTAARKEKAFQAIARQFVKSFNDAAERRSKDTQGHSRNSTTCTGIGRQTSYTNLGDSHELSGRNTKCVGIGRQKSFMNFGDDNEIKED